MTIERIDSGQCIGCAECLSSCPAGVFAWDALMERPVITHPARCDGCGLCALFCPAQAIVHLEPPSMRSVMFPA